MLEADAVPQVLARWLLKTEISDAVDPELLSDAVERVCQKLSRRLAAIITVTGYRALIGRALHVSRVDFPALDGVRAATSNDMCFEGLTQHLRDTGLAEMQEALTAVIATIIMLLDTFIGEDLVRRLLRDIWPDMPLGTPQHAQEADT